MHEDIQVASEATEPQKKITEEKTQQDDKGEKLTEAAGPAVTQALEDDHVAQVSNVSMPFVGRYHTEINCEDKFAHCEKGSAEFIINLLPDGTAHRTFVYKGRVSNDSHEELANRNYKKNTWHYDEEHHQIIVQRIEGIQFFYSINDEQNLVIDRDKILNIDKSFLKFFIDVIPFFKYLPLKYLSHFQFLLTYLLQTRRLTLHFLTNGAEYYFLIQLFV